MTHPLFKICPVCGKRFLKMRKVGQKDGTYTLVWQTQGTYCSNSCKLKAYRKRKMKRVFGRL